MTNLYPKNIFCLESLWNENVASKLSVLPLLDLVSKANDIKNIHLSCNTKSEFEFNIKYLKRRKSYQILYLAFHGSNKKIHFADGNEIDLEELVEILEENLSNMILHFGSCSTLKADDLSLKNFVKKTGTYLVSGYQTEIDWIESAAMDILYFTYLQKYKSPRHLEKHLIKNYPDLIEKTGFKMFF